MEINGLSGGFLCLFAAAAITREWLSRLNVGHLRARGHLVPEAFRGFVDGPTLARMRDYTVETSRFQSLESLFNDALLLLILAGGLFPWLSGLIESRPLHPVLSGFLFFAALTVASTLVDLPFSLYSTFVIEKRYGFSTVTPRLWASDLVKNLLLSLVLLALLSVPLLALIRFLPETWWLAAWVLFAAFQAMMIWLYPLVIAPLFNQYVPVRDETLRDRIVEMAEKAGLHPKGIFEVDAGKRSRHSNAYFTGLGKSKRIVLFDTLLATHGTDEIVSVLAHEIGHWRLRHILKQLLALEIGSLLGFLVAFGLMGWPPLYETFGFRGPLPYAGLLLVTILLRPVLFFAAPLRAAVSRKYERQADDFAKRMIGTTRYLADALRRLAKENLSNLHPHPAYVAFYYSHPPLAERILRLEALDKEEG